LAAFADGHDRGGQCCLVLLLFKAGKKAGDYLRCYHGLLYRTLVAASTALCLGLGGIATSDIEQSSVMFNLATRENFRLNYLQHGTLWFLKGNIEQGR